MKPTTETEQLRADGPVEVREGPLEVVVVVLDPSGDGKHGGLPATWRPLTEGIGVVWGRLPAIRRQRLAGDHLLPQPAGGRQRIHLVGIGGSALLAVAMANRGLVHSLVVVDPPWPGEDLRELHRFIDNDSLITHQIETAGDPESDTTLPIGHPEVVRAIVRVLLEADAGLSEPTGQAGQALHAVRDKIADALESFVNELDHRGLRD